MAIGNCSDTESKDGSISGTVPPAPAASSLQTRSKSPPHLDNLPTELLRQIIAHLDPPSLLTLAALSTHLRSVLLHGAEDLLELTCRRYVGWWWRKSALSFRPHEAFVQLVGLVRERACPVCRLMPEPEQKAVGPGDGGEGEGKGEREGQEKDNPGASDLACSAATPSTSSQKHPTNKKKMTNPAKAHQIETHILLPHIRACRTCLRTHPSLALITATTALQKYGIDQSTLDRVARSCSAYTQSIRYPHGKPRQKTLYLLQDIVAYVANRQAEDVPAAKEGCGTVPPTKYNPLPRSEGEQEGATARQVNGGADDSVRQAGKAKDGLR
ncbi:unnamed protein product [Tilletia caries]|uniref:F-box domain-containing protein n=2 Tax=Tilletia TaxID=13289 RepID=A0A8X7MSY7_9BASI|nr:hypothetical protein CF336_g5314 [Tilletia laevis]KAE8199159.1 hypothetical protein CF328_g3332 [Tilletia controversa]KAE8261419.1 hypothetical protein A4X03_0g3271 [Tilletia caries]KAE8203912.1 hypothetical protein CF335_g2844 [Tilletia laevis]KAE8247968.1 hypothetical protein A4X06_0g4056 [Tilletia controversa]